MNGMRHPSWKSLACVALLLTGMALAACGHDFEQENAVMSDQPSSSRPSPPVVAPVVYQGVRYEQDDHDDRAGDQPGGYLVAIDVATGRRLWRTRVYTIAAGPPGAPVNVVYFRSMRLTPDGTALVVENEAGGVYRVDLATHASTQVSGPPETTATPRSAKPKPVPPDSGGGDGEP